MTSSNKQISGSPVERMLSFTPVENSKQDRMPKAVCSLTGAISSFLVDIVKGITVRPSFFIAKGGITSSDLASKGLSSESALILGQAIAGVPVWQLDSKSKFPEMIYIVFPGNVGDTDGALYTYGINSNLLHKVKD